MPEKINQTLDINQDNKLDTKDIVEMQKIMETVKDSPEAMNQYIGVLTKEIHKLDKEISKDLLDACSTILDSGKKFPKEVENSLKNLKLQAIAIYGKESKKEEKIKIQKSGIESKKGGYDKVMRNLNIAVSKRENFKKSIDKVFDKVGEKKFGKLIKAIEDKHGTSESRDTLIDLIRSESLDEKNIDDILYKLEKGEDFSNLVEKAQKEDKKEEEKEKKLEKAKEKFDIKQLSDYFGINENKAKKLSTKLSEIGLDATIFLNKYKIFIETKLTGLKNIPNGDKYLKKIKLSIGRRFLNLDIQKIMDEKLGGLEKGESIKNARWIMNEILQNKFNFINTELFPSVQFLIKEGGKVDGIKGSGSGNIRKKIEETLKMLNADVLENGDFDKTWKSGELIDANTNTWNIFDTDGTLSGSTDSAIMQHKGIKALENVDLLSEADKKIERDSMMKMMALILSMAGGSLATGPIGALADMGYNVVDFWKNEDLAITMLKQLPQPYGIPKEFHMRKTIFDNIGAILGMIPLLGPAAKVAKVGKLAAKYGLKMEEITELSKVIGKEMASLHKSKNIHDVKFQETVNNVVLAKSIEGKGAKFGEHGSEVKKITDLSKNIDISKLGKIKEGEKYNINGENYIIVKDNKKLVFKSKKNGNLFTIDKNKDGKDFLVKLDNSGNIIKNKDSATAINDVKKVEREVLTKKQIKENALLTIEQRKDKAQELLGGKKLSKEQNDAIIKAHEIGKSREGAGVFNYTQAEILQKAKILKEAGFDKNEVRILMENGIVGKMNIKGWFKKINELYLNLKYKKYDLVIDGKGINFGKENTIKYNGYLLERGSENSLIVHKLNGQQIKGFDFAFIKKGENLNIDGFNFYRPDKIIERVGDRTYVKLSDKNTLKMKKYSESFSSSYSDIAKETGLFEIGKNIDAVGITNNKGGMNSILGIMMSPKGIASKYSGPLTDGGEGFGYLKDTFSGLHGPYFIIKNSGRKEDYNYLFPTEKGIEILKNSLNELKNAGKIKKSEIDSILKRSFTYEDFVKKQSKISNKIKLKEKNIGKVKSENVQKNIKLKTIERGLLTGTNNKGLKKSGDSIVFNDGLKIVKTNKIGGYKLFDSKGKLLKETTGINKAKSISEIEKDIIEYRERISNHVDINNENKVASIPINKVKKGKNKLGKLPKYATVATAGGVVLNEIQQQSNSIDDQDKNTSLNSSDSLDDLKKIIVKQGDKYTKSDKFKGKFNFKQEDGVEGGTSKENTSEKSVKKPSNKDKLKKIDKLSNGLSKDVDKFINEHSDKLEVKNGNIYYKEDNGHKYYVTIAKNSGISENVTLGNGKDIPLKQVGASRSIKQWYNSHLWKEKKKWIT